MNVLHLIDTAGPGGAETIFHSVVTGLDRARWRSVVVVRELDWLHHALVRSGVQPRVITPSRGWDVKYLARLHQVLRRERIDLIHTHLLGSALYGSMAAALLGIPAVCTFHGLPDLPEGSRLLRAKFRIIARRANRVVFVSESLRDAVLGRFTLPLERTRVIYNGIAPPSAEPGRGVRDEVGVSSHDFLVVAVGNLRPAKDYSNLLRATAHLRERQVPIRVVVLGEGGNAVHDRLLAERAALGLGEIVSFRGFVPNAARFLSAADAFVSSSSHEGFSLSTVEALWLETPVVATRSGGPEEIVRDGHTGWLVPPKDHEALASALHEVHANRDGARERAREGAEDVRRRFGRERMITQYEELYSELLGRSVEAPS